MKAAALSWRLELAILHGKRCLNTDYSIASASAVSIVLLMVRQAPVRDCFTCQVRPAECSLVSQPCAAVCDRCSRSAFASGPILGSMLLCSSAPQASCAVECPPDCTKNRWLRNVEWAGQFAPGHLLEDINSDRR